MAEKHQRWPVWSSSLWEAGDPIQAAKALSRLLPVYVEGPTQHLLRLIHINRFSIVPVLVNVSVKVYKKAA